MANKVEQMRSVFKDLDIPYEDWQDNPADFAKRLRNAATNLDIQLKEKNTIVDMEERFKAKATNSKEANAAADEFIDSIMDQISQMPPEVMACVLTRLPEVSKSIAITIRNLSMRDSRQFSKRRTHLMYNRLRKAYEIYVSFMKTFRPEDIGSPPMIPSRPGNYGNDSFATKEYVFYIDDEYHLNYYSAARILGLEIQHYMDIVEAFKEAEKYAEQHDEEDAEINGHKIALGIMGEDEDE